MSTPPRCVMFTGGCGAIGSVMLNYFIGKYPSTRFVNLDALTYAGKASNITPAPNYTLYHGSITDPVIVDYILQTEEPDILIHLAAETHVDNSFGNSFAFTETNLKGTHTLLECACKYNKLQKFMHMSTDEVYGSIPDGAKSANERNSLLAPSNPYSASKAAAEMLCHAYAQSFKLPIIILRCNNAISPFQHEEKLIPRVIKCIRTNTPIPVHGKGEAKRTFIDARDIASAFDMVMTKGAINTTYNIGTEEEYSVMQVIEYIRKTIAPATPPSIQYVQDRAFQDYRYSVDTTELKQLGWEPKISFAKAIQNVITFSWPPSS